MARLPRPRSTVDPRPLCLACKQPWVPPDGVDATRVACASCVAPLLEAADGLDPEPTKLERDLEVLWPKGKPLTKAKPKKSIINTATRGDPDKQRIATPWEFIHALEWRFGTPVDFDLAADEQNTKAPFLRYFTEKQNALSIEVSWGESLGRGLGGDGPSKLAFLNPPFGNIRPWATKFAECRWLRRWTVMLAPASFSTGWFRALEGKVARDAITRIQFEGSPTVFPKDLALFVAGFGVTGGGSWDWRVDYWRYSKLKSLDAYPGEPFACMIGGKPFPGPREAFPSYDFHPDFDWTERRALASGGT